MVITKYSSSDAAATTVPIATSTTSVSPQIPSETTTTHRGPMVAIMFFTVQ